ncbi:MAG: hypothetical protein H6574_08215 [Lewinellaceae bacterium]|nr:hypothetical protein [Saprospiraceae bacterium]MCB9317207.1 hypothetical protein [Lewinellaceae bacterium]MCB9331050.1 hypothetical protein [Lewinellaceae bacterium]
MKNVRIPFFCTVVALALFAQILSAQTTTPAKTPDAPPDRSQTMTAASADQIAPYCDELLPKVLEQMQIEAESNCKTVSNCILCRDRKVDADLYITLFAQPNSQKCKRAVTDIAYKLEKKQRVPDFTFEVLQSTCIKSGVSLELSFPDRNIETSKYSFAWEVDGKPAGTQMQVNCVCGKTASVTVTEKATRRKVVKTMRLQEACGGPTKPVKE